MFKFGLAKLNQATDIVRFIDSTFTKEGYGFVSSAQIKTEIKKKSVVVCLDLGGEIIGVRVGGERVYNLCVHPEYRKRGVGRGLIKFFYQNPLGSSHLRLVIYQKSKKTGLKILKVFMSLWGMNLSV